MEDEKEALSRCFPFSDLCYPCSSVAKGPGINNSAY
jgi:hypothetical protein